MSLLGVPRSRVDCPSDGIDFPVTYDRNSCRGPLRRGVEAAGRVRAGSATVHLESHSVTGRGELTHEVSKPIKRPKSATEFVLPTSEEVGHP